MDALSKDLREFLALCEKHHVRFIIVGGLAVAIHGVPRYTKDLDLWVEASHDNAVRIVATVEEFGFASLGLVAKDFEEPDMVIQLGYEPNRIDLLTGISGVRFDDAYPRRIAVKLGALELPVIDRSSLIANKRASGRPQDLVDMMGLER